MPIRTAEDLIDSIAREHAWRLKEINDLKNLSSIASISETRRNTICRAGTALLYAHWEGFVKKVGTYFLEYVSRQRLPVEELKSNFITLIFKNAIDVSRESRKYSVFSKTVDFLIERSSDKVFLPYKDVVDTKSNLSSKVLKEVVWCLGLDYSLFAPKEKFIDRQLVNRRNYVAHGESLLIDAEDLLDMADEVMALMNIFRNLVENSAVEESFKR